MTPITRGQSLPIWIVCVLVCLIAPMRLWASGYDRAIDAASARVVKLYGLGAGEQEGYGTGIVVSEDGLVLTVLSLLLDAQSVRAVGMDGTRFDAKVVHRDAARQLALIRLAPSHDTSMYGAPREKDDVEKIKPLAYFDVCKPSQLSPGDWVLAAGNEFKVAEGSEPVSMAHGVFSIRTPLDALRRVKDYPYRGDVLVIDAITSNPGAPGSAVVNLDGALVGMIGRVVMSNLTNTNFNYAMPRDVLCEYFTEAVRDTNTSKDAPSAIATATPLAEKSPSPKMDVGIRVAKTGYQKVLPFVEHVKGGSPADKAGVRKDDLILSINGKSVGDVADYDARMSEAKTGERMTLVIRRGRAILDFTVETGETR